MAQIGEDPKLYSTHSINQGGKQPWRTQRPKILQKVTDFLIVQGRWKNERWNKKHVHKRLN